MRPVIARRETTCDYCKKPIEKGQDRLDDVIAINTKKEKWYKRIHYHPSCFEEKATKWFDENRDKIPVYAHGGGRPPLDMSEEDKAKRHKILIQLSGLFTYYMPKLNLQSPSLG